MRRPQACGYTSGPRIYGVSRMSFGNAGAGSSPNPQNQGRTFRMVPDKLWLDPRLKPVDIKLWCVLGFTARGREYTDATDSTLAEMMGMSERTIRESFLRLEECRFIRRKRQGEGRIITLN